MRSKATDEKSFPVPYDVSQDPLTVKSSILNRHFLILVDMCPIISDYFSLQWGNDCSRYPRGNGRWRKRL